MGPSNRAAPPLLKQIRAGYERAGRTPRALVPQDDRQRAELCRLVRSVNRLHRALDAAERRRAVDCALTTPRIPTRTRVPMPVAAKRTEPVPSVPLAVVASRNAPDDEPDLPPARREALRRRAAAVEARRAVHRVPLTYLRFHRWTSDLTGLERLVVFGWLGTPSRDEIAASVDTRAELERGAA